jgi:hypothetical protein
VQQVFNYQGEDEDQDEDEDVPDVAEQCITAQQAEARRRVLEQRYGQVRGAGPYARLRLPPGQRRSQNYLSGSLARESRSGVRPAGPALQGLVLACHPAGPVRRVEPGGLPVRTTTVLCCHATAH